MIPVWLSMQVHIHWYFLFFDSQSASTIFQYPVPSEFYRASISFDFSCQQNFFIHHQSPLEISLSHTPADYSGLLIIIVTSFYKVKTDKDGVNTNNYRDAFAARLIIESPIQSFYEIFQLVFTNSLSLNLNKQFKCSYK
jgi:hypothetical protein